MKYVILDSISGLFYNPDTKELTRSGFVPIYDTEEEALYHINNINTIFNELYSFIVEPVEECNET